MKKIKYLSLLLCMFIPSTALAWNKSETVYSTLSSDGSIYNTIVTSHLFTKGETNIQDETELKNILNINGKENYVLDGNTLKWEESDKDIFYQGEIEKTLPIETTIHYYLNGEEKQLSEILGSNGHVKVEFTFKNNLINEVYINGQKTTLYTPFIVTIGTILSSNDNSNILVTNGRVVDTGSRNIIIGLASPGLYDSLKIDDLKDFNTITLSYDTTNFSLNDIYVVATPKLIEESDFDIFDKINNIYSDVNKLQSSIDIIESGSKELISGMSSLENGTTLINTNLKAILNALNSLEDGSINLNNGIGQIKNSLTLASSELNNNDLETSIQNLNYLKNQNTLASNNILSKTNLTYEELSGYYVNYDLEHYTGGDASLLSLKSAYEMILLLNTNNTAIDNMINSFNDINTKINTLLLSLNTALDQIQDGSSSLKDGLSKTKNGVANLYSGSTDLLNGTKQLENGVNDLSNGIIKFNNEGINTLTKYARKFKTYSDKTKALIDLSNEYNGFASNNTDDTTFVYVIKKLK